MFSRTSLLAFFISIVVTLVCFKSCSVVAGHKGVNRSDSLTPGAQILQGVSSQDGIMDKAEYIAEK